MKFGEFSIRPFSDDDAITVSSWRYDGPWSTYDVSGPTALTDSVNYYAVTDVDTGALVGFVCLDDDARVPGLIEEPGVVDVGVGFDPNLVGQGLGRTLVTPALEWAIKRFPGLTLRAVIQEWNERSIRLCLSLGFTTTGRLLVEQAGRDRPYTVLVRDATLPLE